MVQRRALQGPGTPGRPAASARGTGGGIPARARPLAAGPSDGLPLTSVAASSASPSRWCRRALALARPARPATLHLAADREPATAWAQLGPLQRPRPPSSPSPPGCSLLTASLQPPPPPPPTRAHHDSLSAALRCCLSFHRPLLCPPSVSGLFDRGLPWHSAYLLPPIQPFDANPTPIPSLLRHALLSASILRHAKSGAIIATYSSCLVLPVCSPLRLPRRRCYSHGHPPTQVPLGRPLLSHPEQHPLCLLARRFPIIKPRARSTMGGAAYACVADWGTVCERFT